MYAESNIGARFCNNFGTGKTIIIITYSECVFVALCNQLHRIFRHYLTNGTIFLQEFLNMKYVF